MQNTEKRIAALEMASTPDPFRAVRQLQGESEHECRIRLGIPSESQNICFIQRVIVKAKNGKY